MTADSPAGQATHQKNSAAPAPGRKTSARSARSARQIGRRLASRIGPHKYEMWFGHTRLQVSGQRLEVATDSPFVAKWIDSHFAEDLRGVAQETLGEEAHIDVRVAPELVHGDAPDTPSPREDHEPPRGREHGSGAARPRARGAQEPGVEPPPERSGPLPPPRPRRRGGPNLRRLDEFVVGQSNRLAYSTARRLIEDQEGTGVSPLFIHGECGLGKTHLLQGICRRYAEMTGRREQVRYVTGEQFTNEYISSIRNNTVDDFRRKIRRLDLLAIDDVHFLSNKVRTQGEFLHTLDAIDLTGERIVLASDEHPRLIKRFSRALVSRFLSGMVVEIERPDRETRIAILRRLATIRDLPMNEAAVEAIASRCVASVRELEGTITKLTALRTLAQEGNGVAAATGSEVGLVLVEQLFNDHGWKPPKPVRLTTVIEGVCRQLAIGRADLMGSSRHQRIVLGRGLVAYLGRTMTTHSYPEIARALGRSYHSTVHTAEQRLRRQITERLMVEAGDGRPQVPLEELIDQLRHEITRDTARG